MTNARSRNKKQKRKERRRAREMKEFNPTSSEGQKETSSILPITKAMKFDDFE